MDLLHKSTAGLLQLQAGLMHTDTLARMLLQHTAELIDNAVAATWQKERSKRHYPTVTITLENDLPHCPDEGVTLLVEDNGVCAGRCWIA